MRAGVLRLGQEGADWVGRIAETVKESDVAEGEGVVIGGSRTVVK